MGDALAGAGAAEEAEEARLSATAQQLGAAAITGTTIAAATAALRSVQADEGGGVLGEAANDLRRLRTDAGLMAALDRDLRVAAAQALLLIRDALWMGYRTGATGRAAATGVPLVVDLTNEDRAALDGYPILGHTAAEAAGHLAARLRYELDAALAMPLVGPIDPSALPAALGQVGAAHGGRQGMAVGEAYRAGVQAAVRAIGAALTGAR